jgi:hypothetical protein
MPMAKLDIDQIKNICKPYLVPISFKWIIL